MMCLSATNALAYYTNRDKVWAQFLSQVIIRIRAYYCFHQLTQNFLFFVKTFFQLQERGKCHNTFETNKLGRLTITIVSNLV
jgi:hypothetical protein